MESDSLSSTSFIFLSIIMIRSIVVKFAIPSGSVPMYRYLIQKLCRVVFVPVLLATTVFSGGCVADKQMIPPYQGRAQREAAMQQPGYEHEQPVVEEPVPAGRTPESPAPGLQITADDDLLLPLLTHINERIFFYEQKLAAWKPPTGQEVVPGSTEPSSASEDCRRRMEGILSQYNALHRQILQKDSITTGDLLKGETLLNLEKQDFQFLESDCNVSAAVEQAADRSQSTEQALSGRKAQEISEAYAAGDYEKTIREYENLLGETFRDPPYEVSLAYGKALVKTGRESDGRKVLKDLLARIRRNDQALWEFQLMQLIGDLDFALGTYDSARSQYDEIVNIYKELSEKNNWAKEQLSALNVADEQSEEVKAYSELLRSYLAYNPNRDGFTVVQKAETFVDTYPYSLVASSADHLVTISRKKAEQWYQNLLQQVNDLAAKEKYQEALLVLERVPRTILPLEKQQELAAKATELTTTEAITRETRQLAQEQQLQEDWNAGMTFLERKEYDQAIEAFNKLLDSSYGDRARARIDEAANLAAQEDRKRAAELFVRSNRTSDLESRKRLLLSSRQLLQDILIKYPQSDLVNKVQRNLQRIDKEINAIDPSLLSAPVTVNGTITEPVGKPEESVLGQGQAGRE